MLLYNKVLYSPLIFLCLMVSTSYSQPKEIDSLKRILSKNALNDTNKVNILNQIGFSYYGVNINQLKKYATQALQLSLQLKYVKGEAGAYKNIGLGYLGTNANPMALVYFDKSLNIYKKLNDKVNCTRILNNIGYYYGRINDHKQERSYLLQALNGVNGLHKFLIETTILGNLGNSFEAANQPDSALKYYLQAFDAQTKAKAINSNITPYSNLASAYLKLKKYDQSLFYCGKVLGMIKTTHTWPPKDIAAIYLTVGQLNFQLKKYAQSRQYFDQSLDIGRRTGNSETISEVYHGYYLLDSVKGNYLQALTLYQHYVRLNDSLINANKSHIVSLYEVKFDLQKQAAENERLKIEQEKNQTIINHQHTAEVILVVGLIIIAIGLISLVRINNRVKEQSALILKQNKVLENNNLVKDKLFSVISHDLRNPFTQVIGLLSLWEAGEMKQEEMWEMTPLVKNRIVQTLNLLDNLLIWSNSQLQGFNFKPLPFNLEGVVNENIQTFEGLIAQKKLKVVNAVKPGTIVYADSEMIKVVLRNLISNAVKFTPANGSICIKSSIENDELIIAVEDTGIGITEQDQVKIFSFTSHTTLGTDKEKGTGIGLKICKDFIEFSKGRIWMESKVNEGSKFYVSIPNSINPG